MLVHSDCYKLKRHVTEQVIPAENRHNNSKPHSTVMLPHISPHYTHIREREKVRQKLGMMGITMTPEHM